MKKKRCAAIGIVLAAAMVLAAQATDPIVIKALKFLEQLNAGEFAAAAQVFDPTMASVMPPDKLAEFWKAVPEKLGTLKKQGEPTKEALGPYQIVLIPCEFEKNSFNMRIVFDKEGRIAGIQFVPLAPAPYQPPAYVKPDTFSEKEVTIGEGDWALPGNLTMPKGLGPHPALVLVHGSGPNDRDETVGPNRPFKDLAWGLASRGVAVLRYEKRTRVYGAKLRADPKLLATLTVKEESIDDAVLAARLLQGQEGVDKARIFILGHSLGGMLIPRIAGIASAAKGLGVAGYIVMAGPTRPLEDLLLEQTTYILGLDGTSDEDRKEIEKIKADVATIKGLRQHPRPATDLIYFASPAYWLDLDGYTPAREGALIHEPLLILQGGRDYQVTKVDFEGWKKGLAKHKHATFRFYPDLNHLFITGKGMATPSEYTNIQGSVSEVVIRDIAQFIIGR